MKSILTSSRLLRPFGGLAAACSSVLLVGWAGAAFASEGELCAELDRAVLHIVANGFSGTVGDERRGVELTKGSGATYSVRAVGRWSGEDPSKITGSCTNGMVKFVRAGPAKLKQGYVGWIFERLTKSSELQPLPGHGVAGKPGEFREVAGTFQQLGDHGTYGWHAWIERAKPLAAIEAEKPPGGTVAGIKPAAECRVSGRITDAESLLKLTVVSIRAKANLSAAVAQPAKPDGDGRYAFEGLAPDVYRLHPEIKGDLPVTWDPPYRDIHCLDSVQGVDFRRAP